MARGGIGEKTPRRVRNPLRHFDKDSIMANTIKTLSDGDITNEAFRILKNATSSSRRSIASTTTFGTEGHKNAGNLLIRIPNRYTVATGRTITPQDTIEQHDHAHGRHAEERPGPVLARTSSSCRSTTSPIASSSPPCRCSPPTSPSPWRSPRPRASPTRWARRHHADVLPHVRAGRRASGLAAVPARRRSHRGPQPDRHGRRGGRAEGPLRPERRRRPVQERHDGRDDGLRLRHGPVAPRDCPRRRRLVHHARHDAARLRHGHAGRHHRHGRAHGGPAVHHRRRERSQPGHQGQSTGQLKVFTVASDYAGGAGNVTLSQPIYTSGAYQNVSAAIPTTTALTLIGSASTTYTRTWLSTSRRSRSPRRTSRSRRAWTWATGGAGRSLPALRALLRRHQRQLHRPLRHPLRDQGRASRVGRRVSTEREP
jgi:hypothetical protein